VTADPDATEPDGATEPDDAGPVDAGPVDPPGELDRGDVPAGIDVLRARLDDVQSGLARLAAVPDRLAELARLRDRDLTLIDRLHADNTTLRTGEITAALAPLLAGLLRLHDQMGVLAADDPQSDAGMLRSQLVQLLDTAAGVTAYEPDAGAPFDAGRHSGAGRVPTVHAELDGTVHRVLRPGFARLDGSVVRVAEVEVHRYQAPSTEPTLPPGDGAVSLTFAPPIEEQAQ
jgi:molecular chaperone GrpE (heat shock protein)